MNDASKGRRFGRPAVATIAALGLAGMLAGGALAQSPLPVEEGTFRMGTEPWIGYGPWWIAAEKELFAANGVDATVTNFDTDDEINAALVSGQIDGANIATHTALRLASEGTPLTIVLLLDQSNAADAIIVSSAIGSVADLAGKQVAYEEGTTSDILLRYALAQNGLTIDDIVKVPVPAGDAAIAVATGQVDAAVTYEPYITTALGENADLRLLYTAGERPGLIGDVFTVRTDYLADHPGQIQALLRAWGDAVGFYDMNQTEGQAIMETAVGAEVGSLTTAFAGVDLYDLEEAHALMTGGEYGGTIADVKEIALAAGIMANDVDETALIDLSWIEAVAP